MFTTGCRFCPAQLHQAANERLDEWVWLDEAGSPVGDDPDLPPDPYGHLADLAGMCERAHRQSRRGAEPTWLYHAAVREYSSLKVRLEFGGTFHTHRPLHLPPPYPGPVPEHCGWPAWLRPSGWQCRQCHIKIAAPVEVAS